MSNSLLTNDVTNRKSFIKFLEAFHQDLIDNGSKWENKTLEDFLEALSRYANDIQGYYDNKKENTNADVATWKVFSDMLQGAKVYE